METRSVPDVVVRRLAIYLRCLDEVTVTGRRYLSSVELSQLAGVTAAQVRKDLANFGQFGKQGVGYEASQLQRQLALLLKVDRTIPLAVIGAGELGTALTRYLERHPHRRSPYPFRVVALFDTHPEKLGQRLEGRLVQHPDALPAAVKQWEVAMALLTVPAAHAQEAAERAVAAGIKALLNFAPVRLELPPAVRVLTADVLLELHQLAYSL